jgi:hypothetical protein
VSEEIERLRAVTHAQHAELLALRGAVARVRALHSPDAYGDCPACSQGMAVPWADCETIAALGDAVRAP